MSGAQRALFPSKALVPTFKCRCRRCGRPFAETRSHLNEGKGIYCSRRCYALARSRAAPEVFWSNADRLENGCWEWRGADVQTGSRYRRVSVHGVTRDAHRYAYELTHGPIPAGLVVMHSCDNPPCINPAHLSVGTVTDNNRDALAKGRHRSPGPQLNADKADAIRARYAAGGITQMQLAREYQVTRASIVRVLRGQTYAREAA